jgi:hypothetical protein
MSHWAITEPETLKQFPGITLRDTAWRSKRKEWGDTLLKTPNNRTGFGKADSVELAQDARVVWIFCFQHQRTDRISLPACVTSQALIPQLRETEDVTVGCKARAVTRLRVRWCVSMGWWVAVGNDETWKWTNSIATWSHPGSNAASAVWPSVPWHGPARKAAGRVLNWKQLHAGWRC